MDIPYIRRHRSFEDNRGRSARVFEINELALLRAGESYTLIVTNLNIGTTRGMHMHLDSLSPKLVSVIQGQVFDLCVDMRENSPRKGQAYMGVLSGEDHQTLVIPPGFLHGYQVLEPNSTLLYGLDEDPFKESANNFSPKSSCIVRHWPNSPSLVSQADLAAPDLQLRQTVGLPFLNLEC